MSAPSAAHGNDNDDNDDKESSLMNDDVNYPTEIIQEIDALIQQRAFHRQRSEWQLADAIKYQLAQPPYQVEIIDYATGASKWIPRQYQIQQKMLQRHVKWSKMDVSTSTSNCVDLRSKKNIPLIVATVDAPHYRERYQETMACLKDWQRQEKQQDGLYLEPEPCMLLNHEQCSAGTKGILMEGWKRILLPLLSQRLRQHESIEQHSQLLEDEFLLVAEDDIRFPDFLTPAMLYQTCRDAFATDPAVLVLSLGHAWKDIQKRKKKKPAHQENEHPKPTGKSEQQNENTDDNGELYRFLQNDKKSAGVHATTLLALRVPEGIEKLQATLLQQSSSTTHWDHYLFFSTKHDIPIALCDPPLVGWATVTQTLNPSGSGYRRRGGGRTGFLPSPATSTPSSRTPPGEAASNGNVEPQDNQIYGDESKHITPVRCWVKRNLIVGS